ncbi:MAG: hypothetical protein LC785_08125 [Acidobacteria bacterium]|nr:hypothetical protein [Acidobacteriota bacterium]MCA1641900.1 hypothetical protein [Acidobacteriota bacterium]
MRSCRTVTFSKLRACPSSGALLRYHEKALSGETRRLVNDHVSSCDFCGAELQLLSKFPPEGAPTFQPVRMPWQLYRLAKDLLTFSTGDISRTVEAIYETRNLTLTDA